MTKFVKSLGIDKLRVRATLTLVVALAIWGLTDVRHRARIDPHNSKAHKSDLTVYTEAGEAFFDGRDPYEVTNPRGWHYLYPPLFAIALAPLSVLPSQAQAVAWFVLSVLACWGCVVECRRMMLYVARRESETTETEYQALPRWIGWCALAVMLVPVLNCLQRGQVGTVVLYFLLLGFRITLTSGTWRGALLGGGILALPVAIKLTPALPVGIWLLQLLMMVWCKKRAEHVGHEENSPHASAVWAGAATGAVLFLILLPSVAVGPIDNLHHLNTWVDRVVITDDVGDANDFNERSKRNQSLENAVHRFGNWLAYTFADGPDDRLVEDRDHVIASTPMPMDTLAATLCVRFVQLGLLMLLLAAAWRASKQGDVPAACAVFALAGVLTLLISPLSWVHHYVMWLPALLLVPYLQWSRGQQRRALFTLASAAMLVWSHYLLMDWTGRIGVLGVGTTAWFAVATVWVLRNVRTERAIQAEHDTVGQTLLRAA